MLKHISGSSLNCFDNSKAEFIERYIKKIQTPDNIHFQFGRDFEDMLRENKYADYKGQIKLEEYVEGYKILGFIDFGNDTEWIEVKTKNGWWSKNEVQKSWQFRIYNHFKGDKKFILHQYNKKTGKEKIKDVGFEDKEFIPELYCKIKEMEEFLSNYGMTIWNLNKSK